MKKIEDLTQEQELRMAVLADTYEKNALSGDDSYDLNYLLDGLDFIYALAELKPPQVVICPSPLDMLEQAKVKKGETIDYLGNGYDSGWTAFYDFLQEIGVEFDKEWNFNRWRDFVLKSGVFATVLCENVAFVCIRPNLVKRTSGGNLHSTDGPAIAWTDGYAEYFLNGVPVEKELVETPAEKLDPLILVKEKNAEIRREIVRKIGIERIIQKLGAETIDSKDGYELLLLDLKDGRKREFLKMLNPSIKTFHIEGVPPGTKTVEQALEFRNGTKEKPEVLT